METDKRTKNVNPVKKFSLPFIPPLMLAGVLLILLPIFTIMTLDRLEKQKEFFTQRLMEKGVSLIRTFEAGTRTGMFTMRWGASRIQAMLTETAMQPEVEYIMILTPDGRILAHSDDEKVGQVFSDMPAVTAMDLDPTLVSHRVREDSDEPVFEVFKRFVPVRSRFPGRHFMMRRMFHQDFEAGEKTLEKDPSDWSRAYMQNLDENMPPEPTHYILAGLSMEKERIARAGMVRGTIWRGVLFFLLGCAGIVALFTFQAYRSAKASLSSVKAFSDNVIQNMPSGLVTLNPAYEIVTVNQAASDIFGETLSQPLPRFIELAEELKESPEPIAREMDFPIDGARTIRLDITVSSIRDSEGAITQFLFLFRDLSQIRALQKEVETNRRLAAIGKLAGGVAHEIRNPLSSIKGFATYFGKRYEKNPEDYETAKIMVAEVERINRSITQLLEFSKPMEVEKSPVDLVERVRHSLKLVRHDLAVKHIRTDVHTELPSLVVKTDGDRINQVLLNLYINAVAAMDDGGHLEVSLREGPEEGRVEIRVADDGEGIDEQILDQIFDPYYTTKPTGTGLGLSIVHRIVENLKGRIRVESKKGRGTCFIITLPVS